MIVIPDMDMPISCEQCTYVWKSDEFRHARCSKLDKYFVREEYADKRYKDCPLKSLEEVLESFKAEIKNYITTEGSTKREQLLHPSEVLDILDKCIQGDKK